MIIKVIFTTLCVSFFIVLAFVWILLKNKKNVVFDKINIFLAKIYLLKGDTKNAKKRLNSILLKNEENKEAHKMLGQIYEKEGGARKAIDEYIKVVDLDCNAYDSYYRIAVLLKDLGNVDGSQEMLTTLVNKRPDYLEASITLSDLLCEQERYKEALSVMNDALKNNSPSFELYYNLGMVYTLLNDFSSAKLFYEKAAIINSIEYNSNYNVGMIELILGELDDAEKRFFGCIDAEDISAYSYYQLAKIYILKHDRDTAVKYLNISIELDYMLYKKAMEEEIFNPIKGYISYPSIDEEDMEERKETNMKNAIIRRHLENTYNLVGKLNYREMGNKYNIERYKIEEREIVD